MVTWLVKHDCCNADEARDWVSAELLRRGFAIKPSTIKRHDGRFDGAEYRKFADRDAKHKPAIVLAKSHRDKMLQELAQHHLGCVEDGACDTDAAWLAAERTLYRIAPTPGGKPSDRAENILRRLEKGSAD